MPLDAQHPLRPLVKAWLEKIRAGQKHKQVKFQKVADEVMKFYNGGVALSKYLWEGEGRGEGGFQPEKYDEENELVAPTFRFTMNKVAEVQQLFAPTLYHRNPIRTVTPRLQEPLAPGLFGNPMDPMAQAGIMMSMAQDQQAEMIRQTRAQLVGEYLNYTPQELDLKTHSRRVIDECLMKGMGLWWTEIYQYPGLQAKLVGSFYDTVDNLVLDPDAETLDDCLWAVRKCCHARYEVEREYMLEPGSLDKALGTVESVDQQSQVDANSDGLHERKQGKTADLIVYYKIYSKMGLGGRMTGIPDDMKELFDGFGDNVFLVVAEGIPYPLNLTSDMMLQAPVTQGMEPEQAAAADAEFGQMLSSSVQWPIPFWTDGEWPFTPLVFHDVPNCVWPMSHIAPGLGELKWLNWSMSFLASKVRSSCRDVIAILKAAGDEAKKAIINGGDNVVIELEEALGKNIGEIVSFLQHPPFHKDLYTVNELVAAQFDKRIGLSEILYGLADDAMSRSATDVNVRMSNASVRIEDMANKVEDAMGLLARKEAFAARWMLAAEDVLPLLGPQRAQLWGQLVQAASIEEIVQELDYRVEAGSAQKPNKPNRVAQMNQALQALGALLQQYSFTTWDVRPLNALLTDWCKAMDIDPRAYLLQPPQPMLAAPAGEEGGEEGGGPPQEKAA